MTMGTEQQVVVEKVIKGWCSSDKETRVGYSQFLGVVFFALPNDNRTKYTGMVLLCRHTGKLRLPIYFRIVEGPPPAEEFGWENISMPDTVHAQVEQAARKFAGKLVPLAK
jgi:hypothetical protein